MEWKNGKAIAQIPLQKTANGLLTHPVAVFSNVL
jgi:hypothetical protein